jgi:hypothetical protein
MRCDECGVEQPKHFNYRVENRWSTLNVGGYSSVFQLCSWPCIQRWVLKHRVAPVSVATNELLRYAAAQRANRAEAHQRTAARAAKQLAAKQKLKR